MLSPSSLKFNSTPCKKELIVSSIDIVIVKSIIFFVRIPKAAIKREPDILIDYYKILNLKIDATEEQIRKSFRKLAAIHHPDKNNGSKVSEENFKQLLSAYEILSNKEKRSQYDLKYFNHLINKYHGEHNNQNVKRSSTTSTPCSNENVRAQGKFSLLFLKRYILNYKLTLIIILTIMLFLYIALQQLESVGNKNTNNKSSNKTDNVERPESGEIEFKN